MLKKKDAIIYALPATEDSPAVVMEGFVSEVKDDVVSCLVFQQSGHTQTIHVTPSGMAVGGNGFVFRKDQAVLPIAVNEKIAARMIGFSVPFLSESRSKGVRKNHTPAPPYVKKGRAVRYLVTDLVDWLMSGRVDLKHPEDDSLGEAV